MRGVIDRWIPDPPGSAGAAALENTFIDLTIDTDHESLMGMPFPETPHGTIRSARLVSSRLRGLYITQNTLMKVAQQLKHIPNWAEDSARQLINFITQWDDLLVLTGKDLVGLEFLWTGKTRSNSLKSTKFYVLIEFATYLTSSWEIVREINYLAISEGAFDVFGKHVPNRSKHTGIMSMPQITRPCPEQILRDAINCLCSCSSAQSLISAIACTRVAFHSLPRRTRMEYVPLTAKIGFGYIHRSRLHHMVEECYPWNRRCRISTRKDIIPEDQRHNSTLCNRCGLVDDLDEEEHFLPQDGHIVTPVQGLVLVESLEEFDQEMNPQRHDLCVFVLNKSAQITDERKLAAAVKDLFGNKQLYHTIRHPLSKYVQHEYKFWRDIIWNLPMPYRPATRFQQLDVANWIRALCHDFVSYIRPRSPDHWSCLQLLLYHLANGESFKMAIKYVMETDTSAAARVLRYSELDRDLSQKCRPLGVDPQNYRGDVYSRAVPLTLKIPTKGSRRPLQWLEDRALQDLKRRNEDHSGDYSSKS